MVEPTVACPSCRTEIKLTESLAAPLLASTRKQFEEQLARQDAAIAERASAARRKEAQLLEGRRQLEQQVANRWPAS